MALPNFVQILDFDEFNKRIVLFYDFFFYKREDLFILSFSTLKKVV